MQAHSVIDIVEWLANALLELLYLTHTQVEFGCSVTSTANCRVVDQVDVVPLPIPLMCNLADASCIYHPLTVYHNQPDCFFVPWDQLYILLGI
jgi:hypothetical protein